MYIYIYIHTLTYCLYYYNQNRPLVEKQFLNNTDSSPWKLTSSTTFGSFISDPPDTKTAWQYMGTVSLSDGVLTYLTIVIISTLQKNNKICCESPAWWISGKKRVIFGKHGPQSQSKLFLCFCRSFWYDCQVINFYKLTDWNCQQFPIAPSSPTRRAAATSCSIQLSRCSPLFLGNRKTEGLCMEPLETIIYLSEILASICIDN